MRADEQSPSIDFSHWTAHRKMSFIASQNWPPIRLPECFRTR